MLLYLFRHGIAEDHGPDGTDASRRLTAEGVDRTRRAALGLARVVDPPRVILTSPKNRAAHTAQILGSVFDLEPVELDSLATENLEAVFADLSRRDEAVVMIVGHEPTFSCFAEHLLTGHAPTGFIELKKAGCIALDAPLGKHDLIGRPRLVFLATARMLRAMAP